MLYMAGLGDFFVVVANKAAYDAAVIAGKTSPSVMYLVLAERQIYFNSELWSKAPDEGGGGSDDILSIVLANEEVMAAALADMNEKKANKTDIVTALNTEV